MVQITGTYELESQENYKEYLLSVGLDDQQVEKILSNQEALVIKDLEADKVTITFFGSTQTFPFNQEYEHVFGAGRKIWTTASKNADVLTLKTKFRQDGSLSDERVIAVSDNGLTVTLTNSKGAKAVRQYKRV